jgi:hypothetical protein
MQNKLQKGIYKDFYRNGPNHRSGADVTFGDIVKIFGFRTASIGSWVTQEEQQRAANLFFDALCDLMTILQVNEQVISLRGTLSIAFGRGGNKYSSAHYNSATRTLALAKNAGGGSLAHEYFHAFDHYIAARFCKAPRSHEFASKLWLNNHELIAHPINDQLSLCFEKIFLEENGTDPSNYFYDSLKADKASQCAYYALPEEMAARAFESFVQDHHCKNSFLVKGTKISTEAQMGIYPKSSERQAIRDSFSEYFETLGVALKQQQ